MKTFFSIAFILVSTLTFAQDKIHPTIVKLANSVTEGMCDCFNTHAAAKLSATTQDALKKLAKAGVSTGTELEKTLSETELMAIGTEIGNLMPEGGDFDKCQAQVLSQMEQFKSDVEKLKNEGIMEEEEFQRQFQAQMVNNMQNSKKCNIFYYLYMIGMQTKAGEGE